MAFLALTPLRAEYEELAACLQKKFKGEATQIGKIPAIYFAEIKLCLTIGGHGKAQFALQTQYVIDHFPQKIDALFCCGSAGALSENLKIGDILAGEYTLEYDYKMLFMEKPAPSYKGHSELLKKLKLLEPNHFPIIFGGIASGDEDIISLQRRQELFSQTHCLAVAWEGAGGARACAFNKIPFIELRGITDLASEKTISDVQQNLKVVCSHLSLVILSLILQHNPQS